MKSQKYKKVWWVHEFDPERQARITKHFTPVCIILDDVSMMSGCPMGCFIFDVPEPYRKHYNMCSQSAFFSPLPIEM